MGPNQQTAAAPGAGEAALPGAFRPADPLGTGQIAVDRDMMDRARARVEDQLAARPRSTSAELVTRIILMVEMAGVLGSAFTYSTFFANVHQDDRGTLSFELLLAGSALLALMGLAGAYERMFVVFGRGTAGRLLGPMAAFSAGVMLGAYLGNVSDRMIDAITFWMVSVLIGIMTFRAISAWIIRLLRDEGRFCETLAIVGATEIARRLLAHATEEGKHQYEVLGLFEDRMSRAPTQILDCPVLGNIDDLLNLPSLPRIDGICIALPWASESRILELMRRLRTVPNKLLLAPDLVAFTVVRQPRHATAPIRFIQVLGRPMTGWRGFVKNAFDRVASALGLLVLSPVLLAIAILIKLDSKGPVFFRQDRQGFRDEIIKVWKFRTLYADMADFQVKQQVTADDPRVTRIGRVLRAYSLDELPQLINVLTGEMSLIGPRPYALSMLIEARTAKDILSEYARRNNVKPGITGWAQVQGGYGAVTTEEGFRDRIENDLYYINDWSLWLDCLIIWRTIWVVISGRG